MIFDETQLSLSPALDLLPHLRRYRLQNMTTAG